ncbi:MAG: T9SS type A sorting domain-containing protein [Bacteroidales bacterium]|nr:T9SS type A sorting domain-containing protein [Bacteroidales bacterium]
MKKFTFYSIAFIAISVLAIISLQQNDTRADYSAQINNELADFKTQFIENGSDENSEKAMGQPDMAALQEYFQTMDPKEQRVPKERLVSAQKQLKQMTDLQNTKDAKNLEWENISSNMGGRTRCMMWDPNTYTPYGLWAGAVTGGIWFNEDISDENSEWQPIDDFLPSLSVSSLCHDPYNTNIFYAGTGEAATSIITYRESSGRGVGIYKSEDGGQTWDLLESTSNFAYVTDVKIRGEEGVAVIYAAVASGKYMGEDYLSEPNDGLYRSADGGLNWEQVLPNITGLNLPYTPDDIEFGADGRIYLGTMRNIDGNGGACILFSDAGTPGTWTVIEDYKEQIEAGMGQFSLPGRVMVAPAPSNENIVYAIIGAGYENGFGYYKGNFILKSENKGVDWTELNLPNSSPSWASLSWHAFTIAVDPLDEDHFYIGGLDQYHSKNGGISYTHVSDWAGMYYGGGDDYIHADQHCILFRDNQSDEIVFATDGGIFFTDNGTNSSPVFQERNKSFSSLMFYTCDIHPTDNTDEYIGGLQDNGTLRYSGDALDINDMFNGGDGAYCFYDKSNPSTVLASYYYNRYSVYENGQWAGSFDNGETGTFISPADYDSQNHILFGNGVGFFGSNPNTIFRATGILNNPSSSIIAVGTNINTWFTHVSHSKHSPMGSSTIFLGSNAGDLFKVEEAQATPESIEIGSDDFPTAAISCIAIGGSEDTLLVSFSNYGVSSIWQTYNGGSDWNEIEGNLPDMPVRWALYHPQSSKMAIIATELGVWFSEDLTVEEPIWQPAVEGMANVRVDMLRMRDGDQKVLAATHGRGLYTTNFDFGPLAIAKTPHEEGLLIGPNPSNGEFFIEVLKDKKLSKNITITSMTGEVVYSNIFDDSKIFLNLRNLSTGNYVINIKTSNNCYSQMISIL